MNDDEMIEISFPYPINVMQILVDTGKYEGEIDGKYVCIEDADGTGFDDSQRKLMNILLQMAREKGL